jgi:hypothetical protein
LDYSGFWTTALIGAAAAGVLASIDAEPFERYFGPFDPVPVVATAAVLGSVSLRFLRGRDWWSPRPPAEVVRGALVSSLAALAFAGIAISVDIWKGFPRDMNVAWPRSLLFYPAIAFVAEVAFHVLPLALVVAATRWRFASRGLGRRVWTCIAAVALLEAGFQVVVGSSLNLFVGPHLFAIGVFELWVFRRFGYIPMIWFRLAYYLMWHILWGYARLQFLF